MTFILCIRDEVFFSQSLHLSDRAIGSAYSPGTARTLEEGCLTNIKVRPYDFRRPTCSRTQKELAPLG